MGGNLMIANYSASAVSLEKYSRKHICSVLAELLSLINSNYLEYSGTPLWDFSQVELFDITSGSSRFLFDSSISDGSLGAVYPVFGDIDFQVPSSQSNSFSEWIKQVTEIGSYELIGSKRSNGQIPTLWMIPDFNAVVQIDFEFVKFVDSKPTEWSTFSHASSFTDVMTLKTKGVHHKWFLQSLTRANTDTFKVVHPGPTETYETGYYSLAVSSNEGGGLRRRYLQLPIENERVFARAPRARYIQDCKEIFETLFGEMYNHKQHYLMTQSLYESAILANLCFTDEQKKQILMAFVDKCIGPTSQQIYRNDRHRDLLQKQFAIQYVSKVFEIPVHFHYFPTKE